MRTRGDHSTAKRNAPSARPAFTLVELVLSVAIMGVLMTGIAAALFIAGHALPDRQGSAGAITAGAEAADQIAEELRSALWITEHSATAISFTVPDRDADGVPEAIRYEWSGTSGDALTRQYNGGSVVDLIEDVHEFDLAYDLKAVTEEYPGPVVESAEAGLSWYTGADDLRDFSIDQKKWIGQYFKPTLPGEAIGWRVTRVMFIAKSRGATDGETLVQLRPADASGLPTDTIFEQHTMYESDLRSYYTWREFAFSNVSGLAPDGGLCLVLQFATADKHSANIQYDDDQGAGRLDTEDAGGSWDYESGKVMRHLIAGTYSTPGPPQTATRQYVTGVHVGLRAGDDPAAAVRTAAQTLNTPELLSGWWEADFDTDPRLDHNGDGNADWGDAKGTFNPASLVDGVWHVDSELETYPDNDFVELITAEVRFRNTSIGGNGAVFSINADWSNGTFAPILVYLQLQPDNTQTLTAYKKTDAATRVRLVTVTGLSNDFVDLRLVIDPDLDTVSVTVNGEHRGTYVYSKFAPPHSDRFASILRDISNAEFDYVSVRVAESD